MAPAAFAILKFERYYRKASGCGLFLQPTRLQKIPGLGGVSQIILVIALSRIFRPSMIFLGGGHDGQRF
jgi:hypothetical protein